MPEWFFGMAPHCPTVGAQTPFRSLKIDDVFLVERHPQKKIRTNRNAIRVFVFIPAMLYLCIKVWNQRAGAGSWKSLPVDY